MSADRKRVFFGTAMAKGKRLSFPGGVEMTLPDATDLTYSPQQM